MKHFHPTCALLALALAGPSHAFQDADADAGAAPPGSEPAAELAVYGPMVGSWTGSGTVRPDPDGEAMAWSGTADNRWVVGGHAMLESMHVEMTGADLPPFDWVTLHAFDAEAKSLIAASAGTMGGFNRSKAVFGLGPGRVVTANAGMDEGVPVIEQAIWSARGDSMTIKIYRAIGDGAPYEYVTGSFERASTDAGTVAASAKRGATLAPELKPMAPIIGRWSLEGAWRPGAEAPVMEISGQDTFSPIAGGSAILGETTGGEKGGPSFYEAIAVMGWDAERGVICQIGADNMGGAGIVDQHVMGDGRIASTHAGIAEGTPYADSGVMHFTDGKLTSVKAMRMTGGEAFVAFEGRYTPLR